MARKRTLQLVKPGIQRNGQEVTTVHLADVVKSYNADARPPVTLGHPEDSAALAFGRAGSPRVLGDALVLDIHYTPVLETLEDDGYVEGFSAGIYPHPGTGKYYLHHVAALGELPPAADIKTLDIKTLADVALPQIEPNKLITLSVLPEEPEMTKDEINALLTDALKPLTDKVTALELAAKTNVNNPTGNPTDQPTTAPVLDDQTKKELAAAMSTIKGDRIAAILAAAKAKGLNDDQIKPLKGLFENASPMQLANDGDNSIYTYACSFIDGLEKPVDDNALTAPLELADSAGKPLDTSGFASSF